MDLSCGDWSMENRCKRTSNNRIQNAI